MQQVCTIHPSAVIDEPCIIGTGTKIWHFCHVMSGAKIGDHCTLGQNVHVGANVSVGNRVKIQNNVSVYTGVEIEDDVFLGPSVVFTNDSYPRSFKLCAGSATLIRRGASIGANATVVCGVTIGAYSMIGAGSVVTGNVPDHALVYGNPARIRGWVCACGAKMSSETLPSDSTMHCVQCNMRYRSVDDIVQEVNPLIDAQ
ncbi:MAG: acyltransferase [Patescibacteria group bacterium]